MYNELDVGGLFTAHSAVCQVDDSLSDVTIAATDAAAARIIDDVTLGWRHRPEVVQHDACAAARLPEISVRVPI